MEDLRLLILEKMSRHTMLLFSIPGWLRNAENPTEIFVLSGEWQIVHFRFSCWHPATAPLAAFYWELFTVNWSTDIRIKIFYFKVTPRLMPRIGMEERWLLEKIPLYIYIHTLLNWSSNWDKFERPKNYESSQIPISSAFLFMFKRMYSYNSSDRQCWQATTKFVVGLQHLVPLVDLLLGPRDGLLPLDRTRPLGDVAATNQDWGQAGTN